MVYMQVAFLANPIGVAEHIDYVVTAEKKLEALASAEDKREYCLKQNVIKTVCECGCITTLGHIARHRKTKKHIKIMKEKPSPEKFLKYVEIKD